MSKELLVPRVKVVADYPRHVFNIGDILIPATRETYFHGENGFEIKQLDGYGLSQNHKFWISKEDVEKYPHIFQPLPWYAERKIEELPEYIKDCHVGRLIIKVHKWLGESFVSDANKDIAYTSDPSNWLPATETEYLAYKNSKK